MTWSPFFTEVTPAPASTTTPAPSCPRKQPFRIGAGQREFIGVADAGRLDLKEDFSGARTVELDSGYFKRFAGRKRDGGANIHKSFPRFLNRAVQLCPGGITICV
jgi:hypothetical protein